MSSSSDVVDSPCTMIHEKITSVFNNVSNNLNSDGFIQFWAPVEKTTITGRQRQVVSTLNQPFAHKDEDFQTYRLSCLKYLFSIEDHVHIDQVEEGGYHMTIIGNCGSGPATPFTERLPSVVNLMVMSCNSPLVTSALQCGLILSVFLPVIDRQRSTSCVGVVECSVRRFGLVPFFKYLITALRELVWLRFMYKKFAHTRLYAAPNTPMMKLKRH